MKFFDCVPKKRYEKEVKNSMYVKVTLDWYPAVIEILKNIVRYGLIFVYSEGVLKFYGGN